MNSFLDDLLVGLVLLAGFGYAAYSLGPKALRTRMTTAAASLLGRLPAVIGLRGVAERMRAAKAKGSCGGCDHCGSDAAVTTQSATPEIRIPVSEIGKRPRD